ncbi:SHOCT domain-containing protein [Bradyrhizobium cenepequi]|uniref:SHOCT domain-containing protein n=1 Tax=Bradyrhizobium cenepequi TaxID=2821403 RepID=UPI001CE34B26|nr:SHOCT domain-containing protein [Bradyrhizobium cenepequi]MCA6108470.1 SHOCT domain-containing protein [Bradyrhizobium cenepequi]
MLFEGGFTFSNFLIDVLTIFAFVVWFWLAITIFSDLFRRYDISGWAKAIWVIVVILTPYLGVIIYLITQGRGMTERNAQQAQAAREELRRVVGFSVADELGKLDQLKTAGSITDDEFARLRARLVQ